MSQTTSGSQLPVVATVGTAQTTSAVLADRFGDMPNIIRDFGAPTNGADASAAINAAIAAVQARGGGYITIPNIGKPFMLSAPVVPQAGVHLLGHGMPILQLLPGANCAVIESAGFETDIATWGGSSPASGGVYDCSIEGLVLDGNSTKQQKTANIDLQNGISMYGSSFKLRHLQIQNVLGHGIRTGWGAGTARPSGLRMAPSYEDITVVGTGRNGWWNQGPHDTFASNVLLVNASLEGNGAFYGFWNETSGRFVYLHYWSNTFDASITNFPLYAARSEGWSEYIGCHFESANQCFLANGPHDKLTSCLFYNPTVTGSDYSALVDINSYGNQLTGCFWANVPPASGQPGLKRFAVGFVNTNGQSNNNRISGFFRDFDALSPFNLTHDAGMNAIDGTGYATSSVQGTMGFIGTQASTTSISYAQDGVTGFSVASAQAVGNSSGNQASLQGGASGQAVAVVASGVDAGVGIALVPKQAGALSAAIPDGGVGGGGARGANAVDWQTVRTAPTHVASGAGAAVGGGQYNAAAGACAVVPGGAANMADANFSIATGCQAHTHARFGSRVHSSGNFNTQGDCQKGDTVLRAVTTGASRVRASADGNALSGTNTLPLQAGSAMACRVRAVARDNVGNCALFLSQDVLVYRGSSASATYMAGGNITLTPAQTIGAVNGWNMYLMADQYWGAVAVFVGGADGVTVHWEVDLEFVEIV